MDHKNSRAFSSKILLFGEYLVLLGGQSLSFPYDKYNLKRSSQYLSKNTFFFQKLVNYIDQNEDLRSRLSPRFIEEVLKGIHFESSIPVGYGLGSSGALVAAIYDEFFLEKATDYVQLKNDLAALESFFHEKSSGIDPLTSYLNQPILSGQEGLEVLTTIDLGNFTLYDSGKKRSAKEAIRHFNALKAEPKFLLGLTHLTELSNSMIEKYVGKEPILAELKEYSKQQANIFHDFIPENVSLEWQKGLDSEEFFMKLCGAGMGGMYLKYVPKS